MLMHSSRLGHPLTSIISPKYCCYSMEELLAKYRIDYTELILVRGITNAPSVASWELFDSLCESYKTEQHHSGKDHCIGRQNSGPVWTASSMVRSWVIQITCLVHITRSRSEWTLFYAKEINSWCHINILFYCIMPKRQTFSSFTSENLILLLASSLGTFSDKNWKSS